MQKLKITSKIIFLSKQPDMSNCKICNECIYSEMFTVYVIINSVKNETDINLCENCMKDYKEIKKGIELTTE